MEMRIKIEKEIPRQVLEDIFVTAIEGGSNYWYFLSDDAIAKIRKAVSVESEPYLSIAISKAILDFGVNVPINDAENEKEVLGTISKTTMQDRLQLLSDDAQYKYALESELNEEGDAYSSDIVFQYLSFGKVIFG
jgi:hypothetical protein